MLVIGTPFGELGRAAMPHCSRRVETCMTPDLTGLIAQAVISPVTPPGSF